MSQIFTPSTGETREGGDLRLNVLRIKPGDNVLARSGGIAGWFVAEVASVSELNVSLRYPPDNPSNYNVTWKEIAGVIRKGANADALVARIRVIELKAEEAAKVLRVRKYEAMRNILDGPSFERSSAFVPGM